ncbi:hypothetical protein D3C81_2321200 [compost metagenome]
MDNKAIRAVRFIAFELEAFPEQGEQISIHVGGSWLVEVGFGEHNLSLSSYRFPFCFTLTCDEPFF